MSLSLSKKVLLLFSSLTVMTLMLGLTAHIGFNKYSDHVVLISDLKDFQLSIERLKVKQARLSHSDPATNQAAFRDEFEQSKGLAEKIIARVDGVDKTHHSRLLKIPYYLDNYQRAGGELIERIAAENSLIDHNIQLMKNIRDACLQLPQGAGQSIDLINAMLPLQFRLYHHRELSVLPELKKFRQSFQDLGESQAVQVLLDQFLGNLEKNYLNYLAILDRWAFLDKTADHFFMVTDDTLAYLYENNRGDHRRLLGAVFFIGITALGMNLLFWVLAQRYFNRFVQTQKKAIRAVKEGLYPFDLARPADDEIGELTDAMNELSYSLAESEKKYSTMNARLAQAQKMESIGNLAGGIAHDFNNILFPIVGMAELLLEDSPRQSTEHEKIEQIYKAGKRGSELVNQILTFSRQSEQKKIPIHIQQILREVMKLTRSTIPSNIQISRDIQNDCHMVLAQPTQIHQVAMNLITNAYHAVEPKNGKIAVLLREKQLESDDLPDSDLLPGRYVVLSVSDTGEGISPAIIDKIFEPYFTTKGQGKGTGLGLSVVFGIIKEHHGDIEVYSELGKGTTFNVYFPVLAQDEKSASIDQKETISTGSEQILLVDDEEAVVRLEKQMLERLGYTVTACTSSAEALKMFQADSRLFDLVVSDMTMPDMTGDQLARALATIRPDIPIIICTGFSERINQKNAAAFGVKGFLMKPIIKSDMARMVRNVLDEARKNG